MNQIISTWEEVSQAEGGKIFLDKFDEGIRFIIMKGGSALCGYVGIPVDHPLAGFEYDDIPVRAHGGLTFAGEGDHWPKGYYWYGWDYAHSGDYCDYYDKPPLDKMPRHGDDKKWCVQDVITDSWETIYDFKALMKLAEQIKTRPQYTTPVNDNVQP